MRVFIIFIIIIWHLDSQFWKYCCCCMICCSGQKTIGEACSKVVHLCCKPSFPVIPSFSGPEISQCRIISYNIFSQSLWGWIQQKREREISSERKEYSSERENYYYTIFTQDSRRKHTRRTQLFHPVFRRIITISIIILRRPGLD